MMMRPASVSGSRYAMGMRLGEVWDPPPSLLHISIIGVIIGIVVIIVTSHQQEWKELRRKELKHFLKLGMFESVFKSWPASPWRENKALEILQISGDSQRISGNSVKRQKLSTWWMGTFHYHCSVEQGAVKMCKWTVSQEICAKTFGPLGCNEVQCESGHFKQDCLSEWGVQFLRSVRVEPNRAVHNSACHWIQCTLGKSFPVHTTEKLCSAHCRKTFQRTLGKSKAVLGKSFAVHTTEKPCTEHWWKAKQCRCRCVVQIAACLRVKRLSESRVRD